LECLVGSIPQEKEKIVKEVVKQENAVTAMQAIARAPVLQSFELFSLLDVWGRLPLVFSAENATFLKVDNEFEDSGDNARGKRQIHLTTL